MRSLLDSISRINSAVNSLVWGWPVIILILGTGILLTVRSRALQVRKFRDSLSSTIVPTVKSMGKAGKAREGGSISQFEAFSAAISGTVGTGNIIGVTSAILTGGPGAVFWMWVSAFFGMVTNYAENVLGLYYRQRDEKGNYSGGAMYYITYGLGWKWLGYVAAVFCMLAAVGMSGVQTSKISGTISDALSQAFTFSNVTVVKLIIGVIVAALAALIILGGIKRIGRVASLLVPFMSLFFIVLAVAAILMNLSALPRAVGAIFKNAFNFRAAGSGIMGYAFATVLRKGMARGVFSNEAGLGSSVIAHSASETREPVLQGLWGVFEVFFDTFVICTLTALMVLTTLDMNALTGAESDTATALLCFTENYGAFGTVSFALILPLFAFTTIIAWSYYGEKSTEFCFQGLGEAGKFRAARVFKMVYVALIVVSAVIHGDLLWDISDTFNGLMAIPNLICVAALSGLVVKITDNYYHRKSGGSDRAMLSAYDAGQNFAKARKTR